MAPTFQEADVPAALVGDPAEWLAGDVIAHACPPVSRTHPVVGPVIMPGVPLILESNPPRAGELPVPGELSDAAVVWARCRTDTCASRPAACGRHRALDGLRVVDLAAFLAAPFVSTLLASSGASVVKVEAPNGDPYSVFNAAYGIVNEHKPRMTADLRTPEGRATVLELVGVADVAIDNLIAPSLARLEMTPDKYEAANPQLVRLSVTAYGADGPHAELPGFDPIMQTLSGLVAVQGGAGRPISISAAVHDVTTGCLGTIGVLAALWVRKREGHGQRVFASLAAASTLLQSGELTSYAGRPSGRSVVPTSLDRARGSGSIEPPIAGSPCRQPPLPSARRSSTLLGRPDLAGLQDADRAAAIIELIEQQNCDAVLSRLTAAGVPACASLNRLELDDPFLVENRYSHVFEALHVGRLEAVSGYTDWHGAERLPPLPVEELVADPAEILHRWGRLPDPRGEASNGNVETIEDCAADSGRPVVRCAR